MSLQNLIDCISFNQDIEIFIEDADSGYCSQRQYYGRKNGLRKLELLGLEVDSLEICHYTDRDSTIRILVFSNQW